MNIKKFIKESKLIQEKLNGVANYSPKVTNLEFEGKIGQGKGNKEYLKSIMQKKGVYLAVAPTGTGKTYLVDECYEELAQGNIKLIKWIEEQAKELNVN